MINTREPIKKQTLAAKTASRRPSCDAGNTSESNGDTFFFSFPILVLPLAPTSAVSPAPRTRGSYRSGGLLLNLGLDFFNYFSPVFFYSSLSPFVTVAGRNGRTNVLNNHNEEVSEVEEVRLQPILRYKVSRVATGGASFVHLPCRDQTHYAAFSSFFTLSLPATHSASEFVSVL